MNLDEAIRKRSSIRAFLDKPVQRSMIEEILQLAVKAPSWGNTQPWELALVTGDQRNALCNAFVELVSGGTKMQPDFNMPERFAGVYAERYREVGKTLFEIVGIGREDKQARINHALNMFKAFDAPVLVYILLDRSLDTDYALYDAGALANNICLLAASRGLGTCQLAALAQYPDTIRQHLGLPAEKRVAIGIALGCPDENASYNKLRTTRAGLEENVQWIGFSS